MARPRVPGTSGGSHPAGAVQDWRLKRSAVAASLLVREPFINARSWTWLVDTFPTVQEFNLTANYKECSQQRSNLHIEQIVE
eukprot:scaffold62778_cov16-Tisochrysis_lutea.AAC.1